MMIELDLNQNDADALLRHCRSFTPASGDAREDRRLADAVQELAEAIERGCGSQTPLT
jgi:hypothetical protein